MDRQKLKKHLLLVSALSLLIVLQGVFLFSWTARDTRPTSWDESIHVDNAMEYARRMENRDVPLFSRTYFDYPPLYHLALIFFLDRSRDANDAGAPLNFLFYLLLVASVFLWGRFLKDNETGILAAVFISAYPIVIQMMRFPLIDLPLTAMVSIAAYALVRSDNFKSLGWSLAFGVLAGLAQMTKMTAFLYLTVPVLWGVYRAVKYYRLGNVVLSLSCFLLVIVPWYVPNFTAMFVRSLGYAAARPASGIVLTGYLSWLWYPLALFRQINWILVFIFLPGLIIGFTNRKTRFLLLWLIGSFVLLSLMHNRNVRYSMPALPAVALLSAYWIPPPRKWTVPGALTAAGLVFFSFQLLPGPKGRLTLFSVPIPVFDASPPVKADWKHDDIISAVRKNLDPDRGFSRVVVLSNEPSLHSTSLNVTLRRGGGGPFSFRGPSKRRWTEFASFILYKSGDLGPEATNREIRADASFVEHPDPWFRRVFKPVAEFGFPDGSRGTLYRSHPDAVSEFDPGLLNVTFHDMTVGRIKAKDVTFRVVPISTEDSARGLFKEIRIHCRRLIYNTFLFENVGLILERPRVNLPLFLEKQEIQFLSLQSISPSGVLPADTVVAYARDKLKWLRTPSLRFDGSVIEIGGLAGRVPLELSVRADLTDSSIRTELVKMRIAAIPVPVVFFRSLTSRTVPLTPNPEMPFKMTIKTLEGKGDRFVIGS